MGSRPSRAKATVAPVQSDPIHSEGTPNKDVFGTGEDQSELSVRSGEGGSESGSECGVVAENFQIYKVELLEEKLSDAERRLKVAEERSRRAEQVRNCRVYVLLERRRLLFSLGYFGCVSFRTIPIILSLVR